MEEAHTKPADEVLHYFQTDENVGLDDDQIKRYQAKYGPNGTYSQGTSVTRLQAFYNRVYGLDRIEYRPLLYVGSLGQ